MRKFSQDDRNTEESPAEAPAARRMILGIAYHQHGYEPVHLMTGTRQVRALGFYHRMGFYQVDARPNDQDDIVMELIL